ncbi:MAG: hypothetical protein LBQ82_04860 [Treponema sp.]|jgi:hypothetical protein|nr:hypothetical protein [Treponema sp.]
MKKLLLGAISVLLFAFGGALFAQEENPQPQEEQSSQENPGKPSNLARKASIVLPLDEFHVWRDFPWSLGASFETGGNTRENVETGYGVTIDRYLSQIIALGLRAALHNDGNTVTATEVLGHIRFYTPYVLNNPSFNAALFTQFGFGAVYYIEEERRKNSFTFDFVAGFRFFFHNEFIISPLRGFYLEPFIRTGYPFLFSGGLMIGHWFNF